MASDRRQYDSLEGDALKDELKAYTIQKIITLLTL